MVVRVIPVDVFDLVIFRWDRGSCAPQDISRPVSSLFGGADACGTAGSSVPPVRRLTEEFRASIREAIDEFVPRKAPP